MTKNKQTKSIFFFIAAILLILQPRVSVADEDNLILWNVAEMLPSDSGVSTLRYGALGLGAYPYAHSLPGTGFRVTVDGVPLRSYSHFGPDLEHVPSQLVDSIYFSGSRELNFFTPKITGNEPVTSTSFLLGSGRRFNFDMAFKRMLGEKSGVFFTGSSNGIHRSDDILQNSLRNYFLKYQRYLENGSTVNFSMQGLRDRDGLVNLDKYPYTDESSYMGERKTDEYSISLGIHEYPLGKRTTVSPLVYYQDSNSRFERYGNRKSLDDNVAGINVAVSTKRGNTSYKVSVSNDTRLFDSKIHNDSWTRTETDITTSFMWKSDSHRLILDGGFVSSSEYGSGAKIEGEYALKASPEQEFVIHGFKADEFPDTGKEYYTSLVFSDITIVSDLEKYTVSEMEIGLRFKKKLFNFGLFGFRSSSELPMFMPSSAVLKPARFDQSVEDKTTFSTHSYMSSREKLYGYRIYFDAHFEKLFKFDVKTNYRGRDNRNDSDKFWPYPSFELFSDVKVSGKFINDLLNATAFGNARFTRWDNEHTKPDGNYFLLDCGIVIKVSSLELFYRIENLTNENIVWLDTMGWLGRNAMWGGRWVFYN